MEDLLSLAFDNLSSFEHQKVRKGLRQIDSLLAQICLSDDDDNEQQDHTQDHPSPPPPPPSVPVLSHSTGHSRGSRGSASSTTSTLVDDEIHVDADAREPPSPASSPPASSPGRKDLAALSRDPAFREFFKLQEGWEWNVATRLVLTLDRLLAQGGDGSNDLLILSALDLVQGVMLLHPPSKGLFAREQNMNLLLDLLEPVNCPAIQSATLLTLVAALISHPRNTRTFEALDGLLTVTSLFRSRSTPREVKLKLVEFLYFYLMPEEPSIPRAGLRGSVPAMLQRSPSKLAGAFAAAEGGRGGGRGGRKGSREAEAEEAGVCLGTEEKQALLGRYLSSVEDLVRDLRDCAPFGGVVC